jgi:hypothetical protein
MIDTQQQYIRLNICGEISIIMVQANGQEKRYMHITNVRHFELLLIKVNITFQPFFIQ